MFLLILSSRRLGTTVKRPWCCLEEMHIYTGMDNLFEQPASSRLFRRFSVQGVIRTIVVLRYYVIRTIVVLTQYNANLNVIT